MQHCALMNVRIYHNPRCSKSREALALLQERGIEPEVVAYLEADLSVDELTSLLRKLGCPAHALLRTKEEAYAAAQLSEQSSDAEIFAAIRSAPVLLERPIVEMDERAVIARPPEKLLGLLV